jgi:hypothetical protein
MGTSKGEVSKVNPSHEPILLTAEGSRNHEATGVYKSIYGLMEHLVVTRL